MRAGRAAPVRIAALVWAAGLSACAVGPNYHRPAAPTTSGYGAASAQTQTAKTEAIAGGDAQRFVVGMDIPSQWWTLFHSEKLNALVAKSLKGNPSVGAAQAAVRQAHELYSAQWASLLPSAQASFSADRSENAAATLTNPSVAPSATYSLYTAQLNVSYAPDLFGLTRRQIEAAKAQLQFNRYQLEATYLTLSSNVVVTAIQEASLRAQIAATERLLQMQHQITAFVQRQRELGTASELDLLAQQSTEAQTAQTLAPLRKQLGQTRDALTALLGRLPADEPKETFGLDELSLPVELPVSIPAQLIEQRPDVRQAEENLHMASAAVGIATANLLPQFAISGNLGSTSLQLSKLFSGYTEFWDLGASLTQTLFDSGALIHKRRAAYAGLDQAGAQYRAAVILACQNVADSLRALQADADALKASADSARAAKQSFDFAQQQHQLGSISLLSVLNAEQLYRQAELALVQAQANRYADTAGLFQALGGGWWNRKGEPQYEFGAT
jgi:NodT family efflux transporter outer membrane factor (OMF) lipoprotein